MSLRFCQHLFERFFRFFEAFSAISDTKIKKGAIFRHLFVTPLTNPIYGQNVEISLEISLKMTIYKSCFLRYNNPCRNQIIGYFPSDQTETNAAVCARIHINLMISLTPTQGCCVLFFVTKHAESKSCKNINDRYGFFASAVI